MGFLAAFTLLGTAFTATTLMAEGGGTQSEHKTEYRGLTRTSNFVVLKEIPHAPRAFT